MNDARMRYLLEAWFRERETTPPNATTAVSTGSWSTCHRPASKVAGGRSRRSTARGDVPSPGPARVPTPATNGLTPARGFTMFSALKFTAAAVIVALFGGFLLAGVLTTPQEGDEMAPAAVTARCRPRR